MKELLDAWLIEGVVLGSFVFPILLIVHGVGELREDSRRRRQRSTQLDTGHRMETMREEARVMDPADMSGCTWGDFDEPHAEIFDARTHTRRQARRAFHGHDYERVRVRVRYARWLTQQESWERGSSRQNWGESQVEEREDVHYSYERGGYVTDSDSLLVIPPEPPELAPEGWEGDEYDPSWDFCERDHPQAVRVYFCEGVGSIESKALGLLPRRIRNAISMWKLRRYARRK